MFAANEWVAELLKDGSETRQNNDSFSDSFDQARGKQKGVRVSKPMDNNKASTDFLQKVGDLFGSQVVKAASLPDTLQKHMNGSFFGIDESYDKVSAEGLNMATGRLTLKGTRCVVVTEMLQLHGYMSRKGVYGSVTVARMSAFLRGMSAALLTEYAEQGTLWARTIQEGEFLFTPFGYIQGELVSKATVGIRVPFLPTGLSHPNALLSAKSRKEEMDRRVSQSTDQKEKATSEQPLLQVMIQYLEKTSVKNEHRLRTYSAGCRCVRPQALMRDLIVFLFANHLSLVGWNRFRARFLLTACATASGYSFLVRFCR